MKRNLYSIAMRPLALVLALIAIGFASNAAVTVVQDGIVFSVDTSKKFAAVAKSNATSGAYTGEITIPEEVEYSGVKYPVTTIAASAFANAEVTKVNLPASVTTTGTKSFSGSKLVENPLTEHVTTLGAQCFLDCKDLVEAVIPSVSKAVMNYEYAGCSSLKKVTILAGEGEVQIAAKAFGEKDNEKYALSTYEEVFIDRAIGTTYPVLFKGQQTITKVTIGKHCTALRTEEFMNCAGLETLTFEDAEMGLAVGTECFSGCSKLAAVAIPSGITELPRAMFDNCTSLADVTLPEKLTRVGERAFENCKLTISTLPETVSYIGVLAFANAITADYFTIPNNVTTIGSKAFMECDINNITLPNDVALFGSAVFALSSIKHINLVDNGTVTLTTDELGNILYNADRTTIYFACPIDGGHYIDEIVQTVDDYAFAGTGYLVIDLPNVKKVGYAALSNTTKIEEYTMLAGVDYGTHLLAGSSVKKLIVSEGIKTIPVSTAAETAALTEVVLPSTINVIMNNAFAESALKTIKLGAFVNYLEAGAIPNGIETIVCENYNVPVINSKLFVASQNEVVCKVPEGAVADYKAAAGWNYLNIQGDPEMKGEKAELGCPTGLYFATKDAKLMYMDSEGDIKDTGIPAGLHAFQLGAGHDRVYVGYAGSKFTYVSNPQTTGEGEVFYLNNSGGSFFRVTLVSNIGFNAFEDPFSLSVDVDNHELLVADRNVGVHKINTEDPGLYGQQPFILQNNWLPWYGGEITYGAIGCGMVRDSEGTYWMGKKFNANGIFRFKETDIYPEGGAGHAIPSEILLGNGTIMTTFTLDEKNGYLYCFLQQAPNFKAGIYRFEIATLKAKGAQATFADGVLIDDSPVLQEGSAPSELTGVTQISSNGEKVYWSYIAPKDASDTWIGKDWSVPTTFDPENPLHHSGIKCIDATGADNTVSFAIPDVEAYGCVAFVSSHSGVNVNKFNAKKNATVMGSTVVIPANAKVNVVALNGAVVSSKVVKAGEVVTLNELSRGAYLVSIKYAEGGSEVVKVIR